MTSHEVIKEAIAQVGTKRAAMALNVSQGLIYKWSQSPKETKPADAAAEGVKNPLDRVVDLFDVTGDTRLINYLCQHAGGFFVPNPSPENEKSSDQAIFEQTQRMFGDFSTLLSAITQSTSDDKSIDPREAKLIRDKWETLKRFLEQFVRECEAGHFHIRQDRA